MGFDKAPVLLGFQLAYHTLKQSQPLFQPRRNLPQIHGIPFRSILSQEDQLAHNLLHPRRARFWWRGDDDIVIARLILLPTGTVQDMALIDSCHLG